MVSQRVDGGQVDLAADVEAGSGAVFVMNNRRPSDRSDMETPVVGGLAAPGC